ncbi:TonB family protein [Terriglobus sp. TAA 43]|uniref:TonB family protein n=1 Tax=Terriglobus sp. TAA 43 TaxID=278961 RepID=UPI000646700B|nr:TonB family protein [Terriglobus sp. TAA 43]
MRRFDELRGVWLSAGTHALVIAAVVLVAVKAPQAVRVKLPGSAHGTHTLLTYTIGGQESAAASSAPKKSAPAKVKTPTIAKVAPAPVPEAKPETEKGDGSSGVSALGSGNVRIAIVKVFPRPAPDLSSLPRGKGGNVIMDAVIDAHGTITKLTLEQGLGDPIDQQVMATVRGWSFDPATRDGQPIASEQEIVLHYERG